MKKVQVLLLASIIAATSHTTYADMRSKAVIAAGKAVEQMIEAQFDDNNDPVITIEEISQEIDITGTNIVSGILAKIGVAEISKTEAHKITQVLKINGANIEASHLAEIGVASVSNSELTELLQQIEIDATGDITARAGSTLGKATVEGVKASRLLSQKIYIKSDGKIDTHWASTVGAASVSN